MIFHLIDSFRLGGTERQATELIIRLRKLGYQISIGCLNLEGPLLDHFRDEKISEYRLKRFLDPTTLKKIFLFSRELRKKNIRILHCHDFYTNIFGTIAGRMARIPTIINSRRDMGDLIRPSQQKLQKIVSKMATHIVVNAKAIQKRLIEIEKVPLEKTSVIYNGIDLPDLFRKESTKRNGGIFRIGTIANFNHPVKGHFYLLKAAALVVRKVPKVEFFLAGDGPLREDAQNLARKLGIEDKVYFTGRIDPSQILGDLDLYVSPSLSEGLSNSVIEAMAYGTPVVATRVGGNVELIETEGSGLLVEPANPESLAEAIIWMLEHPLICYEMGLAGRYFIKENLSWEYTCRNYQSVYRMLLKT